MCVFVAQSYLTFCDLMDCSPPGFSVHGISQERILEWVVIPFFRGSSWSRDRTWVSCIAGRFFSVWATRGQLPKTSRILWILWRSCSWLTCHHLSCNCDVVHIPRYSGSGKGMDFLEMLWAPKDSANILGLWDRWGFRPLELLCVSQWGVQVSFGLPEAVRMLREFGMWYRGDG